MKLIPATLIVLASSALFSAVGELTFKRLQSPPNSITEKFFKVEATDSVKIDGELIERVIIKFEEGKSHARVVVLYKNTTSKALSPRYTIRFYNSYGILMAGIRVREDPNVPESLIEPGKESGKTFHPKIIRLDRLFRHTDIKEYPPDFFKIGWLSIADTNSKNVEAGTGQPATRPESNSEGRDKPQPEAEGRSR